MLIKRHQLEVFLCIHAHIFCCRSDVFFATFLRGSSSSFCCSGSFFSGNVQSYLTPSICINSTFMALFIILPLFSLSIKKLNNYISLFYSNSIKIIFVPNNIFFVKLTIGDFQYTNFFIFRRKTMFRFFWNQNCLSFV